MAASVKSLEDRVDDLEDYISSIKTDLHILAIDFAFFKSKMETIVSLLKWIGIFVAGLTATTVFNIVSISNTAGKIETNVDRLREAVQHQEQSNRNLEQ